MICILGMIHNVWNQDYVGEKFCIASKFATHFEYGCVIHGLKKLFGDTCNSNICVCNCWYGYSLQWKVGFHKYV